MSKTCNTCGITKRDVYFYIRTDTGRRRGRCAICENKARDLRRKANLRADLAKTLANNAERQGILINPGKCSCCKEPKPLQKHHDDYEKPYDVVWLCQQCHSRLYAKKRGAA